MKRFNYVSGLPTLRPLKTEENKRGRYYVTPGGRKVPSVTTVIGYHKRAAISEWRSRVGNEEANRISGQASGRGTRFHSMMEKYLSNEKLDKILHEDIMPDMKQCFMSFKKLADKINNIHYLESPLYSETLRIAGRTDCIAEFENELSIIDFKTAKDLKKEEHIQDYFQQGTAYALMYEELVGKPINQIVIMISPNNGAQPQLFVKQKDDYVRPLMEKILSFHADHS